MKTKKTLILFALIFLGISAAHAQIPGFTLGIKAGYVYSSMTKGNQGGYGSFNSDIRPRHAETVGIFARFGNKNYFQPEFNFEAQGANFYYITPNGTNYHVVANVNRIDIPLLYGRKLILTKKANFRFNIGPEIGLKTTGINRHLAYIPTNYQYRAATVGAIAGVGADIGNVTFDLRYDLGLTPANAAFDSKFNLASFTIGYRFF